MALFPKYRHGYITSDNRFFETREEAEAYELEVQFKEAYSRGHNKVWISGNVPVFIEDVRHWLNVIDMDMSETLIDLVKNHMDMLSDRPSEPDDDELDTDDVKI